jgi:hypothetical protein
MDATPCPNCGGPAFLPGRVVAVEGQSVFFSPAGTRAVGWNVGIPVSAGFQCCLRCGHLWSRLAPEQVKTFIGLRGTELGKQYLETLLEGPYHDLPDDPAAREAADKAAEIDALVVSCQEGAATRRFRELTGKTWDQSIADLRHWRDHDRTKKLALFGWRPKEKAEAKGHETQGHPMRDRWLDG